MIMKDSEISQKIKNKSWLSIQKILYNEKKRPIIIITNYFYLEKLGFSWSMKIFFSG